MSAAALAYFNAATMTSDEAWEAETAFIAAMTREDAARVLHDNDGHEARVVRAAQAKHGVSLGLSR